MKIVDRAAFLKLPAGVIYAQGEPWVFDGLHVKGENVNDNDWYARPLDWIASGKDDGEQFSRLNLMLEAGASYPIADYEQRDGSFNADAIFLIYEAADLDSLQRDIEAARAVL